MSDLAGQMVAVLEHSPGLSARELVSALRRQGFDVHKRDLNPILYHDNRFENDGGYVPRWRRSGAAAGAPFRREDVAASRSALRDLLDERQATVARLRSGNDASTADDDVRQALALLRSRGYEVTRADSTPAPVEHPAPAQAARSHERIPAPRSPLVVTPASIRLRPWQEEALARWIEAGGVGVCEAVTGTGKTHLGLEAVAQAIRRGERATVLVPSILLQRQWEQRIQRFVPEAVIAKVGGTRGGDPERADVVIAVVHSALRSDLSQSGPNMTLLVADEAHRYGGEGWGQALRDGYPYRLGLTATLERGGDDGVDEVLMPYFDRVVHKYGFDRASSEGVVAPFDLVFLGVRLEPEERDAYEQLSRRISQARKILISAGGSPQDLNRQLGRLRALGGDVTRAVMTYESSSRERRRLLAETPGKHEALRALTEAVGESRGTVLFTQSKETADAAAWVLSHAGLEAAAIYSEGMEPAERQRLIDALADRRLDALAAPRILDEGVDIPDVDLGIVMGASSSRRQMIQRLGRVIRLKDDNRHARFVVLFAVGSVEDPDEGGREDFMAEIEHAARNIVVLRDWDEAMLDEVWNGTAPRWERKRPELPASLAALLADQAEPASEPAEPAVLPARSVPVPAPVRRERVSRPAPPPTRPVYPDPVVLTDLLEAIDGTDALARWLRAELDAEKVR